MAKRVNRFGQRDLRLAVKPSEYSTSLHKKKSERLNVEDVQKNGKIKGNGRPGYAERAKYEGLFMDISAFISKYRTENKDSTFKELYLEVYEKFPTIFKIEPEKMYPQNFAKVLQAVPEWNRAYYGSALNLIDLANFRLRQVLENEKAKASDIVNAYDKVMKYNTDTNIGVSAEDNIVNIKMTLGESDD